MDKMRKCDFFKTCLLLKNHEIQLKINMGELFYSGLELLVVPGVGREPQANLTFHKLHRLMRFTGKNSS